MRNLHRAGVCLTLLGLVSIVTAESPTTAPATQPMAAQFDAMRPPALDQSKRQDESYMTAWRSQMMAFYKNRGDMAVKLLNDNPDPAKVANYVQASIWSFRLSNDWQAAGKLADSLVANSNPAMHVEGLFFRCVALASQPGQAEAFVKSANDFIAAAPSDPRGAELLTAEQEMPGTNVDKAKITQQIIDQYPNSQEAASAKGELRRLQAVGKPFDLTFTDAINGKKIDIKDLKGKVVVVDFWATWCGPCVGEMPNMKKLYSEYKDKGVEFLGISLDQPEVEGGLKMLRAFCETNQITWPQYYQGNGWESAFSKSWGINSIPTMFILDSDGNLNSVNARGQLEVLLPKLIAERDSAKKIN